LKIGFTSKGQYVVFIILQTYYKSVGKRVNKNYVYFLGLL